MKKGSIVLLFLCGIGQGALACTTCNIPLQNAIAESADAAGLFRIFLPFLVLGALVIFLYMKSSRYYTSEISAHAGSGMPVLLAAIVMGIGAGGFVDGIVFHQILQWHSMLSQILPPVTLIAKSVNMFWDGIFHAFTLIVVITGAYMLFRSGIYHTSAKTFWSGMLGGWGIFNLLEGLLNHQIFKLHAVNDLSPSREAWNIGFLIFSVLLLVLARILYRSTATGHSPPADQYDTDRMRNSSI